MKIPSDMQEGMKHKTKNSGELVICKYDNARSVHVRFLATGYKSTVNSYDIRRGEVKDYLYPSVYGIGAFGIGNHKARDGKKMTPAYSAWLNMLQRVYDVFGNSCSTYQSVTICDEWHNFQCFADWFYENAPDNMNDVHIDKDVLSGDSKIYSSETCSFIGSYENVVFSNQKLWKFISPAGEPVEVTNLKRFCRDNDINYSCMRSVYNGLMSKYKGWTVPS